LSRHTSFGSLAGMRIAGESGQASVELIGTLPALVLVALIGWQLLVAGQTAWLSANAARVAARAVAVGRDRDAAARSALPSSLARGMKVSNAGDGRVRVSVPVPLLLSRWRSPLSVSATAGLQ
jgi:pilus assembly protein CpaE